MGQFCKKCFEMKPIILKFLSVCFFVFIIILSVSSQSITGAVFDSSGAPLSGATVEIKGTNLRTTSTTDGNFSITPKKSLTNIQLMVSFTGFTTVEVPYQTGESVRVLLPTAQNVLNEVVVTALGIKREEKSLGYAAQTVSESAVKDARSNNWVNSLSGKVAGLNIQGTGSGPIGSSRITLRGESSLNLDNNQALIVVDGVPISSKITGTGFKAHLARDNPVDFGSTLSDINPDDIEKITVLKGAGATALYGSRAAGGAIIITTKSGNRKGKGIGVTYNTNVSIDQVNRWPDYQYEYGEGRTDKYYSYGDGPDGPNTSTTVAAGRAWGPKFDGQSYYQYDPNSPNGRASAPTPWVADKNCIKGFFRTGLTVTNSVSLEGGSDKGSPGYRLPI